MSPLDIEPFRPALTRLMVRFNANSKTSCRANWRWICVETYLILSTPRRSQIGLCEPVYNFGLDRNDKIG